FFIRKMSRLTVRLLVGKYLITATWFNRSYIKKQLSPGDTITITGKWDQHRNEINVSEWQKGEQDEEQAIQPVYHVKDNISVKFLRRLIQAAFKTYVLLIPEILPQHLLERYKLMGRKQTLYALHFPDDYDVLQQARRRFVYEEFLLFQLKIHTFKKIN